MTDTVHLPYTLQTQYGMVVRQGLPIIRNPPRDEEATYSLVDANQSQLTHYQFPTLTSFRDYNAVNWKNETFRPITNLASICLREQQVPSNSLSQFKGGMNTRGARYTHNINACRSSITVHHLETLIRTRARIDLEQAAAAVVSAFMNESRTEDACSLVEELGGLLTTSNMWIEDFGEVVSSMTSALGFAHLADKLQRWLSRAGYDIDRPRNYTELVPVLLRILRRSKQRTAMEIPTWIFEEAGLQHLENASTNISEADLISLPRKTFRALQRRVRKLFQHWKTGKVFKRDVDRLESQVLYAADWIGERLRETDDVSQIAFWFFAYTRRLQKKVVSNISGWSFLEKGEGSKIYQNNLAIRSTFEVKLARLAGHHGDDPFSTNGNTLELIDQTCLLMKRYVDIWGYGKKENLCGHFRGPVDHYNLLCDVLKVLRDRARDEDSMLVPGPAYKFLAHDIMACNSSWADDAFAGGKIHAWETWLVERQLAGVSLGV